MKLPWTPLRRLQQRPDLTAFDAFLSYKHEPDSRCAAELQRRIEEFGGGSWWSHGTLRLFRDRDHGSGVVGLARDDLRALERSQFFILCASPEAALAPWIKWELDEWIRLQTRKDEAPHAAHILVVLMAGELKWTRWPARSIGRTPTPFLASLTTIASRRGIPTGPRNDGVDRTSHHGSAGLRGRDLGERPTHPPPPPHRRETCGRTGRRPVSRRSMAASTDGHALRLAHYTAQAAAAVDPAQQTDMRSPAGARSEVCRLSSASVSTTSRSRARSSARTRSAC